MAKQLSQTKAAIAARARTRAKMMQAGREIAARAEKIAPLTKAERIRAYLRTPEGQQKLRDLQLSILDMHRTTLQVQQSVVQVQIAVARAQQAARSI